MIPVLEQLYQLQKGPVWDGNLISKPDRDHLLKNGYIMKENGFNFLSRKGIKLLIDLKLLKISNGTKQYIKEK